ncbi:TetR/AcrR family transcriptional regulator [Nocardioides jensenii]|uniref:TetR/AcrR family transcriptional regulator n=1 Tax=Nocardioides jensenii TaxID=1843 RepID=UPI0009E6BEF1|nr:TetR/AcrR family transcriptional regulator [Nocardioides jensenii]
MAKGPTPREVARTENIARIKRLALSQLSSTSAGELSLRAIARELNIVSSAIYRYYSSRDELITALIVDAYDDLGRALEEAGAADRRGVRRRWSDTCRAMREWALAEPHRFALVYGSAIPGYRAPQDTIAPAGRVVDAFFGPVVDVLRSSRDEVGVNGWSRPGRVLLGQLEVTDEALGLEVSPTAVLALLGAFARVIGALTLELNGHFVGGFEPADALFDAFVDHEATLLGL